MSTKVSDQLTADGVVSYHGKEYAAHYSTYLSETGRAVGVWFGGQCEGLGLVPETPASLVQIERLANGADPHTGKQLVEWHFAKDRLPAWMKTDEAWQAHVRKMLQDAVVDGREYIRENAGGEKLTREVKTGNHIPSFSQEGPRTQREKRLLEMHSIALDLHMENLAGERGEVARRYIKERGIRLDTAKEFGVGLALGSGTQLRDKLSAMGYSREELIASGLFVERGRNLVDKFRGRIMFSIENERGETIAFTGRRGDNGQGPKYLNSPTTEIYRKSEVLYNLHRAAERIQETGRVVVVEGHFDAIAAYQCGQRNVVAKSGSVLTPAQVEKLSERATTAILNGDADPNGAGQKATEKDISLLLAAGLHVRAVDLKHTDPSKKMDPADWIRTNGGKEYRRMLREVPPLVSYLADQAPKRFDMSDAYGKIEAYRWMTSILGGQAAPEQRMRITAELEEYLQVPKIKAAEEAIGNTSGTAEHRAAWDITFGAPKTVSLTGLVGGDRRVIAAHDYAAREALTYLQRWIQVKMGGNNAPQTTGKLVAVLFRHDTARPVNGYPAPHLHTHCVVFNMSQDRDGQFRALEPREIYRLQAAAEAVYQSRLALRLKELGYELEYSPHKLAIEVKGYTQGYRDAESQRTAQIEAEKEKRGEFGPRADSYIALATREEKLEAAPEHIKAMHLQHAAWYGYQPQLVVETARGHERVIYDGGIRAHVADQAIRFAKSRLSEHTTVMELYEIHKEALRFGRGYIGLPDIEKAFARARQRGEFHGVSHWRAYAPESRWTTPDLIKAEREILEFIRQGRDKCQPIVGSITRDEFREQFRDKLNDAQKKLAWWTLHSTDRIIGVQGIAGAGKTRVLATIRDFAERYGYEVRGVAATTGAVAQMRDPKVGIEAETIAKFLVSRDKHHMPRLYMLDEASLADVHQMAASLRKINPTDRVIVIGDVKQHASVGAGRIFAEMQDAGMRTFRLRTIVRQKDEAYREVIQQLSDRQIDEAIKSLDEQMRIHETPNQQKRYEYIGKYNGHLQNQDPEHTILVVSPDNRSKAEITEMMREQRAAHGRLHGEGFRMRSLDQRPGLAKEDLKLAANYERGDVIEYHRLNTKTGLRRGDRASVMEVDRDKNRVTVVRESDGKIITYNPNKSGSDVSVYIPTMRHMQTGDRIQFTKAQGNNIANRALGTITSIDTSGNAAIKMDSGQVWCGNLDKVPFVDYGYVMTSHSAQGATVDQVLIHIDTDAPNASHMATANLIYTAASRAQFCAHVFTNSREDLPRALKREEIKAMALSAEQITEYRPLKERERGVGVSV